MSGLVELHLAFSARSLSWQASRICLDPVPLNWTWAASEVVWITHPPGPSSWYHGWYTSVSRSSWYVHQPAFVVLRPSRSAGSCITQVLCELPKRGIGQESGIEGAWAHPVLVAIPSLVDAVIIHAFRMVRADRPSRAAACSWLVFELCRSPEVCGCFTFRISLPWRRRRYFRIC